MRKIILLFILALPAFGQVTVSPFVSSGVQFLDNSGHPLASGKVCTFAAGSTTPQASYSDNLGTSANTNPVVLDSGGRANIFLTAQSYKIVIAASTANSQCVPALQTADNVSWATIGSTVTSLISTGNVSIQASAAATSGANQSSPTDCTQGNYWTGAASAADKWCWQNILGTGSNPTSTYTLTHSGSSGTKSISIPSPMTLASTLTVTGASTLASVNNRIYVGGTTYPLTTTGVQAAITAACAIAGSQTNGTKVYLPSGTLTLTSTLIETCPLTIEGAGLGLTTINASTDILKLSPSANFSQNQKWDISGIQFATTSGRAIWADDSTFNIDNLYIHDNQFYVTCTPGSAANCAAIANSTTPGVAVAEQPWIIERNFFTIGGIFITQALAGANGLADGLRIADNFWLDTTTQNTPCMNLNSTNGAAQWLIIHNTGGCAGGAITGNGSLEMKVLYNQFEQATGTGDASGCMIHIDGSVFSVPMVDIVGNNINQHTNATHGICLGTTTDASIERNLFDVPTGGSGVDSSADWYSRGNSFTLHGTATRASGAGVERGSIYGPGSTAKPGLAFQGDTTTGWSLCFPGNGTWCYSTVGTNILQIGDTRILAGSGVAYDWASVADPRLATADTGLTRKSAGIVSVDTTAAGNSLGKAQGADWIGPVGATTPAAGSFTTLKATSGVGGASSAGIQHGRVTTGSIGAASRADVTLTWTTAFANTSYTPVCEMIDTSAAGVGMRVERIRTVNAGSLVVQVVNDAAGALTGTLSCMAMHD